MARAMGGASVTTNSVHVAQNISSSNLTGSIWFLWNATTSSAGSFQGIIIARNVNTFVWGVSQNGSAQTLTAFGAGTVYLDGVSYGGGNVSLGVWHHLAFTGTGLGAVTDFAMGSDYQSGVTRTLNGTIADGAAWNVVLTAAEIAALAQGARPNTIRRLALLGYWPITGLQSPEPDLSGNAFNGTLTGTTPAFGPPIMQFTPRWPQSPLVSAGPTIILPFDVNMGQGYRQTRVVAY